MNNILSTAHYRKPFYFIVVLILVIAGILRFSVLPHYDSSVESNIVTFSANLLDALLISLLVTVFHR